jgi:peptidoglycan/LPS O-acetylase OafA/YrhL
MLGGFRLILAIVVVLYHAGFQPFGLHVGVTAVAAFYMVSGYAMSAMWRRWYADGKRVAAFYLDRLLRLYPQYVAFCAVSATMLGLGWRLDLYQVRSAGWAAIAAHVTMIPLSLATVYPDIGQAMLIPQSWSLGTELLFYLMFPALQSRFAIAWALTASLCVFTVAASGAINPDVFAYRLLPGCLFIFLVGALIERNDHKALGRTVVALASIALVLTLTRRISIGFNREILFGVATAILALSVLAKCASGKLDALLGDLSYGIYLSHFTVIAAVDHFGGLADNFATRCGLIIAGSVLAALAGLVLVERPAARFRKGLRKSQLTHPRVSVP